MPHLSRISAALAVALFAVASAQAQQVRSVRGVPNPTPSASARAAQAAPNPAGLRPLFPAGLNSGSGASQSSDNIARTTTPPTTGTTATGTSTTTTGTTTTTGGTTTGTTTTTTTTTGPVTTGGIAAPDVNSNAAFYGAAAATTSMGAGYAAGPSQFVPSGSAGFSAVDIARSFLGADANRDGELSRSEARRLSLVTMTFEEMDRNFDGSISRGEYEDGLR